jgi:hypothetical protein
VRPWETSRRGAPGEVIPLPVTLRHEGLAPWSGVGPNAVRLGVRLLDANGRDRGELRGASLPASLESGTETLLVAEVRLPQAPGSYHLQIDCVEEQICWFAERGSTPAVCELEVVAGQPSNGRRVALATAVVEALAGSGLDIDLEKVRVKLLEDGSLEDLVVMLRRDWELDVDSELRLRAALAASWSGLASEGIHAAASAPEPLLRSAP